MDDEMLRDMLKELARRPASDRDSSYTDVTEVTENDTAHKPRRCDDENANDRKTFDKPYWAFDRN